LADLVSPEAAHRIFVYRLKAVGGKENAYNVCLATALLLIAGAPVTLRIAGSLTAAGPPLAAFCAAPAHAVRRQAKTADHPEHGGIVVELVYSPWELSERTLHGEPAGRCAVK
jgi:hypothetical protein